MISEDDLGLFTLEALNPVCQECEQIDLGIARLFNNDEVVTMQIYCKNKGCCKYLLKKLKESE